MNGMIPSNIATGYWLFLKTIRGPFDDDTSVVFFTQSCL